MECGGQDWWCQLIQLVFGHSAEIGGLSNFFPWLTERLQNNIQGIAGLIGIAFGAYRWWYSNEKNMHKRLREYLAAQDQRLVGAQRYVLNAIDRPGLGGGAATAPIFAIEPLRRVLAQRNWPSIGSNEPVERQIGKKLDTAIDKLEKQIQTSRHTAENFQRQLAGAYVLKGAVASAIAKDTWTVRQRLQHDIDALNYFRTALNVPGFAHSISFKRLEAHQLRKLGHLQEATAAYLAVEEFAANLQNQQERDLTMADAMRWRAAIEQSMTTHNNQNFGVGPQGRLTALALLQMPPAGNRLGALDLRKQFAPFQRWDALDQAEIEFLAAYLCHKLQFWNRETNYLNDALANYNLVLRDTRGLGRLASRKLWKLRQAAKRGKRRIENAQNHKQYDERWLLPPPTPLDDMKSD